LGTRDSAQVPNVLRLIDADTDDAAADQLWLIQADLDDMPPEYAAAAQEALLRSGAVDAVISHISMKKGRPGMRLEVLAPAARLDDTERVLLQATSTLGVRRWPVQRTTLERHVEERVWEGQRIRWKKCVLPDGSVREKPEFDDVERAARALGLSPWEVRTRLGGTGSG
jgi:pyridinium-3,5-bisthiocarboxylic acid mononucleotide nickel chelatase